jgi:hypothetical protein
LSCHSYISVLPLFHIIHCIISITAGALYLSRVIGSLDIIPIILRSRCRLAHIPQKSKLLLRSSCRSFRIPGGSRGSSPSLIYPESSLLTSVSKLMMASKHQRTEGHLDALFRIEPDCWKILGTNVISSNDPRCRRHGTHHIGDLIQRSCN